MRWPGETLLVGAGIDIVTAKIDVIERGSPPHPTFALTSTHLPTLNTTLDHHSHLPRIDRSCTDSITCDPVRYTKEPPSQPCHPPNSKLPSQTAGSSSQSQVTTIYCRSVALFSRNVSFACWDRHCQCHLSNPPRMHPKLWPLSSTALGRES